MKLRKIMTTNYNKMTALLSKFVLFKNLLFIFYSLMLNKFRILCFLIDASISSCWIKFSFLLHPFSSEHKKLLIVPKTEEEQQALRIGSSWREKLKVVLKTRTALAGMTDGQTNILEGAGNIFFSVFLLFMK